MFVYRICVRVCEFFYMKRRVFNIFNSAAGYFSCNFYFFLKKSCFMRLRPHDTISLPFSHSLIATLLWLCTYIIIQFHIYTIYIFFFPISSIREKDSLMHKLHLVFDHMVLYIYNIIEFVYLSCCF